MSSLTRALSAGAPIFAVAIMGVSLLVLLIRYAAEPFAPNLSFGRLIRRLVDGRPLTIDTSVGASTANRQLRRRLRKNEWALHNQLHIIAWILCLFVLSRLVIFASALVGSWLNGNLLAFFSDFRSHWIRWDAIGYLSVAENGYTPDTQAYMVLLPLYPMLTKLLSLPLFGNTALAGTLISNVSLIGAAWALFLLVQEKQGQICARRAVQLFLFCPLSVFFSVPYAESLFLFLTLTSILLARRQKFIAAVCMGMLAAFTRLAGILTIIPVLLEVLKYERSIRLWPRHKARCIGRITFYTVLTLMISLGFFAYLLVNQLTLGDPLAFVQIQSESWNQTFGSLANTLKYSIETAFIGDSPEWLMGVWLPQSAGIVLALILLMVVSPWTDPGDGLYSWAYLALTLAPTWLLTGPRMIFCMYPLYPMLVRSTRKNGLYLTALILFLLLMILCSYMYAVVGNIL